MAEKSGFGLASFYERLSKSYDALRPVSSNSIGERMQPTIVGKAVELVSVGRLLYFRMLKQFNMEYLDKREGQTHWNEHVETYSEKNFGLMTGIGEFDFTIAMTVAKDKKIQHRSVLADVLAKEINETNQLLHGKPDSVIENNEREDKFYNILDLQNKAVANMINSRLKGLDKTEKGTRLLAKVTIKDKHTADGALRSVEPEVEFKGWPFNVRVVVVDENDLPIGFKILKFKKNLHVSNVFSSIDWNDVIRGGTINSDKDMLLYGNTIETSELYYLDEWYSEHLVGPDIVVGMDSPKARIVDLTHDRRAIMHIGIGKPVDRTGTIKIVSPTHRPNIGVDFVGVMETADNPTAKTSVIEDLLSDPDLTDLIDYSDEASLFNENILVSMGEYEMQVTPIKSILRNTLGSVSTPDYRQQKEDVLILSSLMEYPVMAKFAERINFFKVHQSFVLPDILNQEMLAVPRLPFWKQQKLMGVSIPAFAAALLTKRSVGVDMALGDGDMTLAPLGLGILQDVTRMINRFDTTEDNLLSDEKYAVVSDYIFLKDNVLKAGSLRENIKLLKQYCIDRGALFGENDYDADNFWRFNAKNVVENLEKELSWLDNYRWILEDNVDSDSRLLKHAAEHVHEHIIGYNSQLEVIYWRPIVRQISIIREKIDVNFEKTGLNLDETAIKDIEKSLLQLHTAWTQNYGLSENAFRSAIKLAGFEADEKYISWSWKRKLDPESAKAQLGILQAQLMRASYNAYVGVADKLHLEEELSTYLKAGNNIDRNVYSPQTMMPLSEMREVLEQRRMGPIEVSAGLGSAFRPLEPVANKAGAAGVTSTVRFGAHMSRLTLHKKIRDLRKQIGATLLFSSAGAANGTVEVFAQINEKFDRKKILTEPRNVLEILLPVIRANKSVETALMGYIDGLDASEMGEGDKSVLLEMLRDTQENQRLEYVRNKSESKAYTSKSSRQLLRLKDFEVEKMGEKTDVRVKILENAKAAQMFEVFEGFARSIESGDLQKNTVLKAWIDDFSTNGFKEVMKKSIATDIAEFEMQIAGVLIAFRNIDHVYDPKIYNYKSIESTMKLRKARFDAKEKVRKAQIELENAWSAIGRTKQ